MADNGAREGWFRSAFVARFQEGKAAFCPVFKLIHRQCLFGNFIQTIPKKPSTVTCSSPLSSVSRVSSKCRRVFENKTSDPLNNQKLNPRQSSEVEILPLCPPN